MDSEAQVALQWLIVGGGIHGVHLATLLLADGEVSPEALRILDPEPELLARWRTCTATVGMEYLRSPGVHHLAPRPWELQDFASKRVFDEALFQAPFGRPSLALFNEHCRHVVAHYGLEALHIRGRAISCRLEHEGVRVETTDGRVLEAERVVLALGSSDEPLRPAWASADPRVEHVFAREFSTEPRAGETVAVVGGGITAVQVALRWATAGARVHLLARHALREHQFDSDPGWLGPRNMTAFREEPALERRRVMVDRARHRGSVPPALAARLSAALEVDRLRLHQTDVGALDAGDRLRLTLADETAIEVDRVLLATGFVGGRPGGALVDDLVASAMLPCSTCGFPEVDPYLRWHPRVFVSGALAELEIGPVARNIAGARRAGERVLRSLRTSQAESSSRSA